MLLCSAAMYCPRSSTPPPAATPRCRQQLAAFCTQALSEDVVALWRALFGSAVERVPVVVVGHSMGGAVAVRAAASKAIEGLQGVVVIDVVEGTALGALWWLGVVRRRPEQGQHVQPTLFPSLRGPLPRPSPTQPLCAPCWLRSIRAPPLLLPLHSSHLGCAPSTPLAPFLPSALPSPHSRAARHAGRAQHAPLQLPQPPRGDQMGAAQRYGQEPQSGSAQPALTGM